MSSGRNVLDFNLADHLGHAGAADPTGYSPLSLSIHIVGQLLAMFRLWRHPIRLEYFKQIKETLDNTRETNKIFRRTNL